MTGLADTLLLAAYTSRSQAYAQALCRLGLTPGRVLLFGDASKDRPRAVRGEAAAAAGKLFIPDLDETLAATCERAAWTVERAAPGDINHPDLARRLAEIRPGLVVYSGYGGQLVGRELLGLGIPFLHMHAGWLPEFGGSTTIYYGWLREGRCAVTAFLLDPEIDNGPIVARRRYPLPPAGVDVDHLYDGAIRADLLVRVLAIRAERGQLPSLPREGVRRTYYVIHPVLKHLALLSRETVGHAA